MRKFNNNNSHIMNWTSIEPQAHELATRNNTNTWRDKFHNTNIGCSSKLVTNCTKLELHNYVCC